MLVPRQKINNAMITLCNKWKVWEAKQVRTLEIVGVKRCSLALKKETYSYYVENDGREEKWE